MRFNGKRGPRFRLPQQLRFPSDLAWHVKAMAQMGTRTFEQQILHLVKQGIRFEEERKADEVTTSHTPAHGGIRSGDEQL